MLDGQQLVPLPIIYYILEHRQALLFASIFLVILSLLDCISAVPLHFRVYEK